MHVRGIYKFRLDHRHCYPSVSGAQLESRHTTDHRITQSLLSPQIPVFG